MRPYISAFQSSPFVEDFLRQGRIIGETETSQHMIERVVDTLFSVERQFRTPHNKTTQYAQDFGHCLDQGLCVMSTPILTNAGRYPERSLCASIVPDIDLHDTANYHTIIQTLHRHGMGTSFNLSAVSDPVKTLRLLNDAAVTSALSGQEDRPVGNMAILSVYHPHILSFIDCKRQADQHGENWKFNISVDVDDDFMMRAQNGEHYTLLNGQQLSAGVVFDHIVSAAHDCADTGIVYLNRLEHDNPTPGLGHYTSTAPCAEVGFAPGESCPFGYVNLGKYIDDKTSQLDSLGLKYATRLLTRALDNSIELSIGAYSDPAYNHMLQAKRKIGIGVCGVADLLTKLDLPYDSLDGRIMIRDLIALVNFTSKDASHDLARERGAFPFMTHVIGNRYKETPSYLARKYQSTTTRFVTSQDWDDLLDDMRYTKTLRNASTTALPPTGRSGLIVNASTGIEPLFSLKNYDGTVNPILQNRLMLAKLWDENVRQDILQTGSIQNHPIIPGDIQSVYKTALDIAPLDHVRMVAAVQPHIDESVSKTINLPGDYGLKETKDIFLAAHQMGLKGLTIYRNNSRQLQPRSLS